MFGGLFVYIDVRCVTVLKPSLKPQHTCPWSCVKVPEDGTQSSHALCSSHSRKLILPDAATL